MTTLETLQEALVLLVQYQWSDWARSQWDDVPRCRQCLGMPEGRSLNLGGGQWENGTGHKPECTLNNAIQHLRDAILREESYPVEVAGRREGHPL